MIVKELDDFSQIRYKARAYFSYIFSKNFPYFESDNTISDIENGIKQVQNEISQIDIFYILDANGNQIGNAYSNNKNFRVGDGMNLINKAYFYNTIKEKKTIITEPYPSSLNNKLCVSISYPIFDENHNIKYIVVADISLNKLLQIISPSSVDAFFGKFSQIIYALFGGALFCVSLILFISGINSFIVTDFSHIKLSTIFETTIILTLSMAIFDLVKAIFDAEVLGHKNGGTGYETMIKFIASIIIALGIESLMLVFKFAINSPEKIIYAVYLIAGVSSLIISLSIYIFIKNKNK